MTIYRNAREETDTAEAAGVGARPAAQRVGGRPIAWHVGARPAALRVGAKYGAMFRTQLIAALAYPADLAGRSLGILIFLWVFIYLWRATYASTGEEAVAGLTLRQTLWYLTLAEAVWLSRPRPWDAIARAVKDGSIAYLLNKPYNLLLYQLATGLADGVAGFACSAVAGGALTWLAVGPPPDAWGWLLVVPTVAAAWGIDYCLEAMIGLAAFVVEDITAFQWIYSKVVFVLGGMLIPLDFLPLWLRQVAQALPFAYTVYGPARLFVEPGLGRFVGLLGLQAFWLVVLGLLLGFFYRRGVSRLVINGG